MKHSSDAQIRTHTHTHAPPCTEMPRHKGGNEDVRLGWGGGGGGGVII